MQTFYKVFLILFIVFFAVILYAFEWEKGWLHEDNTKYLVSLAGTIVGGLLTFVLSTWSKLASKRG